MPPPVATFIPFTGDTQTDALLFGTRWGDGTNTVLSYSFALPGSLWEAAAGAPAGTGFAALAGAQEQQAVRSALAAWSAIASVGFQEVGVPDPTCYATRGTI